MKNTIAETVVHYVQEAMRQIDPQYSEEEQHYLASCAILERETDSTKARGYIRAREQRFACDVLYAAWQGFVLNLRIFQNPVNALLLGEDFEELYQERKMYVLPGAQQAQERMDAFVYALPEERRELTYPLDDYYSYMQTVGYKLAHYMGFLFGNRFLPKVIPGYTADKVHTDRYTSTLREFLQMDTEKVQILIE